MDRVYSANYCLGVLGLLLLQGLLSVEGRSILNTGNNIYYPKEEPDAQRQILALLLNKSLVPIERNDIPGLELVNKLSQLEKLRADLDLERKITADVMAEVKSLPGKRGEPCFWKYCV
ncbi:urotensin 2 domain containing [Gadus macrocephalus]|uniref:urotensin 2 domain containing n=1 Tax=Gadus macrocephalus TaxID=80720 RepID=UPI0028CB52E2|nr:urotensin 2 domain containing [Gadus macrocephalus]